MCLDSKWTVKDKRKWLKKQPDNITAYKVVSMRIDEDGKERLCSVVFRNCMPFKRTNESRAEKEEKIAFTRYDTEKKRATKYVAYFHLFEKRQDAFKWGRYWGSTVIIECEVPKRSITDVGSQEGVVIITKKFTIIGEDEYIDKED